MSACGRLLLIHGAHTYRFCHRYQLDLTFSTIQNISKYVYLTAAKAYTVPLIHMRHRLNYFKNKHQTAFLASRYLCEPNWMKPFKRWFVNVLRFFPIFDNNISIYWCIFLFLCKMIVLSISMNYKSIDSPYHYKNF